jgi:hypothetical protein
MECATKSTAAEKDNDEAIMKSVTFFSKDINVGAV